MKPQRSQRMARLAVLLIAWSLLSVPAFATTPHLIRYQGQAVDSQGVPLEGPRTLTFRLYDAETGGNKVWEETQRDVPLTGGYFSVLLGQVTSLASVDWAAKPLWLAVKVGESAELTPRQRITSVPTAIVAERLADESKMVPSGAIILWTGANCPTGYSRLVTLDGKFLVGGASYNPAAGGSNTHTHGAGSYVGPRHTHSVPRDGWDNTDSFRSSGRLQSSRANDYGFSEVTAANDNTSGAGGTGAITGTSASADNRPEFATVLLCQKD